MNERQKLIQLVHDSKWLARSIGERALAAFIPDGQVMDSV